MYACDNSAGTITSFFRTLTNSGTWGFNPIGPTSSSLSGCGIVSSVVSPVTINNVTNSYTIEINIGAIDSQLSFRGYRVGYKLQVSPAPGAATFADVPISHPLFQFIEALAASGITAGCTAPPNPNYCPNDPVTRAQMAVFLSRALGLHFAP